MDPIPESPAGFSLSLPEAAFRRLSEMAAATREKPVDLIARLIDEAWAARPGPVVTSAAEPVAPVGGSHPPVLPVSTDAGGAVLGSPVAASAASTRSKAFSEEGGAPAGQPSGGGREGASPSEGLPPRTGGPSGGLVTPGTASLSPSPVRSTQMPPAPEQPRPWPPLPTDIFGLEAEVRHLDLLIQTAPDSEQARLGDRYAEVTARLEGLRKG